MQLNLNNECVFFNYNFFSVVSGDEQCCHILAENDYLCEAVVRILQEWYAKEDIVVRLTYCMGNLLAKSENMRIKVSSALINIHLHIVHQVNKTKNILSF